MQSFLTIDLLNRQLAQMPTFTGKLIVPKDSPQLSELRNKGHWLMKKREDVVLKSA